MPPEGPYTAGSGYSLARPMMSEDVQEDVDDVHVEEFSAANTYSSGLRDGCLFPSSS